MRRLLPQGLDTAELSALAWRLRLKRQGTPSAFSGKPGKRVLILSEQDAIPQAQVFPFYFFHAELDRRQRLQLREVPTAQFEAHPEAAPSNADIVFVQTWFDWESDRLRSLFERIRQRNPNAKLVYLDWFAPTDLRLAESVGPHVDAYVKKHVFRDRSRYGQVTRGDTNLTDHFGAAFSHDYPETLHRIPPGFLDKLIVGPTFSTGHRLLPYFFHRQRPLQGPRIFDVHARLAATGERWYRSMREDALRAVATVPELRSVTGAGVNYGRYMAELHESCMCFSPFGYGEVCWRDFEAILAGSLLFKPHMAHIEVVPEVFVADETYVALEWDLSDYADKVRWWRAHDRHREHVVAAAYRRVHEFSRQGMLTDHLERLLK